jgi:hypothetical protein
LKQTWTKNEEIEQKGEELTKEERKADLDRQRIEQQFPDTDTDTDTDIDTDTDSPDFRIIQFQE